MGIINFLSELIVLISFLCLIVGLFNPKIVLHWSAMKTRKRVLLVYGVIFVLATVIGSNTISETAKQQIETNRQTKIVAENNNKQAQKQIEFSKSYDHFKKINADMTDSYGKLKSALEKTSRGEADPVKFYNYLKSLQNLYSITWQEIDKNPIKKEDAKYLSKQEVDDINKALELESNAALSAKAAVEALMAGMENNTPSIKERSDFSENIEKALVFNNSAADFMEKVKSSISDSN